MGCALEVHAIVCRPFFYVGTAPLGSRCAVLRFVLPTPACRLAWFIQPRRRAIGMLMSVLGTTAPAIERCTAIEEELHQSQVCMMHHVTDTVGRGQSAVFGNNSGRHFT